MSLRTHGATSAFVRQVLDHYGWGDEQELLPFFAAHEVYDEIWRLYDSQRFDRRTEWTSATDS